MVSGQLAQHPQQQRPPQVFEFTRRKKWAHLIVQELPETILFVLSTACKVLYCGPAVKELLGWAVEDLLDVDLADFINGDDQHNFHQDFLHSIQTKQALFSYTRLKCKAKTANPDATQKELLFEIKGKPYYAPHDSETKCVLAMAKLYPTRNTAILNTFLELKMENERLSQRIAELRANPNVNQHSVIPPLVPSQNYPTVFALPRPDNSASERPLNTNAYGKTYTGFAGVPTQQIEEVADDVRKKKPKKAQLDEQQHVCVTCGRTNSPEWRKGPLGPKTLCNACGLRWSKAKKEDTSTAEGSQLSRFGQRPPLPPYL